MPDAHMMPDRSDDFFGREPDLRFLADRASDPGFTAVVGSSQMGKTWLLEEAGRRLLGCHCLVGYHECLGESDQFLHTTADMYCRWLESASYRRKAGLLARRHKKSGALGIGKTIEEILAGAASMAPLAGGIGEVVRQSFYGLARLNQDLCTGGLIVPPLAYDQVRELLWVLYHVSGNVPLVLVLDQWDQSPTLESECNVISTYLARISDWPPLHVFAGIRNPDARSPGRSAEARRCVDSLQLESGKARVYDLLWMCLDNPAELSRVAKVMRALSPQATEGLSDEQLAEILGGDRENPRYYPGVLRRLRDEGQNISSPKELRSLAENARLLNYPEMENSLSNIVESDWSLFTRLAFLPQLDNDSWCELRQNVLANATDDALDRLEASRVLEYDSDREFPSFGHLSKQEAARKGLLDDKRHQRYLRDEIERLAVALASEIRMDETRMLFYAIPLMQICSQYSDQLGLSAEVQTLGGAARSVLGIDYLSLSFDAASVRSTSRKYPCAVGLLAICLYNTLNRAAEAGALGLHHELLGQLRQLYSEHAYDTVAREHLAMALFNTLCHVDDEHDTVLCDELLEELRALARDHQDDAAVREAFAKALVNTQLEAHLRNDLELRNTLLRELRVLTAEAHSGEAAVRGQLAIALANAQGGVKTKDDLAPSNAFLEELRQLSRAHMAETAVRVQLAKALYNAIVGAKMLGDLNRRDQLLNELRRLAEVYSDEEAVLGELAAALANTIADAKDEDSLEQRDELLQELRALASAYPDEAAVRGRFAIALANTQLDAMVERNLERRDELLQELRGIASAYPDEAAVRGQLAIALANTHVYAMMERDFVRRDELLAELRRLAEEHSDESQLQVHFARALANMQVGARLQDDLERRSAGGTT